MRGGVFAEFFALEVPFCISKASCERVREELLLPESDCLQGERLAGRENEGRGYVRYPSTSHSSAYRHPPSSLYPEVSPITLIQLQPSHNITHIERHNLRTRISPLLSSTTCHHLPSGQREYSQLRYASSGANCFQFPRVSHCLGRNRISQNIRLSHSFPLSLSFHPSLPARRIEKCKDKGGNSYRIPKMPANPPLKRVETSVAWHTSSVCLVVPLTLLFPFHRAS
ncbi:hypothetical protein NA56DRAFT_196975 [Hyaloscypha hepaticicola]|uniref:Uncharacterized protein n=1 Tax=Hyaloscypha hepaticicola TaxID=2082293 RepID=A0A2J6Q058_9HELO|nr:hypothetical protein NA56DRAFT_196975 [Hyaloscypha hepaticicola]